MADQKVTVMVLEVDLQCACCYKKIKKILCKFPQIRDQVYDVKANTVTITVVCCNPEKIRDKLCCKGRKVIKRIEIKEPPKTGQGNGTPPPPPRKPPEHECPRNYLVLVRTCCGPCSEGYGGGPCYHGYGVPPSPQPCYGGYCGCGCGQRWGCRVSRCGYYLIEDNPQGCSIM